MTDFESFLETLEDMPTQQLGQLNRLLEAVRQYLPRENLTATQMAQRTRMIGRYVARLHAGMTDAELDNLIEELKKLDLSLLA